MSDIRYLDFDLLIEGSEEEYQARVLDSPVGCAAEGFVLPFSDLELENFILRVGRTRRGVRRVDSPEMEAAKVFGERLFDSIFQGEVRGCYRSSLDEAKRQGAGLRIRLRLYAPELADTPWEYLYNEATNRFLSLSVETPLVRYLDLPGHIPPLTVKPPLRVLVMISSPKNHPPLDVEHEWAMLQEAVGDLEQRGQVMLERLEEATLSDLQRRLRRGDYHIFHFVGHGAFDRRAEDGVLMLEDVEGLGRPVNGQSMGALLNDERTLRLVILNACEGARTSRTDPFSGTAQSLIQQGTPAVIAMQFEITDEAAITFAYEFYGALADGYPVDAALAEARKAIFAQGNDVEWGTPVLYSRVPGGRVFDVEAVSEEERQAAQITAHLHRARVAMTAQEWASATEQLEAVLLLDPQHAQATALLGEIERRQRQTIPPGILGRLFPLLPARAWSRVALAAALIVLTVIGAVLIPPLLGGTPTSTPTPTEALATLAPTEAPTSIPTSATALTAPIPTATWTPPPPPSDTPMPATDTPVPPTGIELLVPEEGAVLDNGRKPETAGLDPTVWDFDWADYPRASQYHLYVIGPGATIPLVDAPAITTSSYQNVSFGYVPTGNLSGWTWKVRAAVDGVWGEWSEVRTFSVEPPNSDPPLLEYVERPHYTRDCGQRPSGSICLVFSDGYRQLVYDAIQGWADGELYEGKQVSIAQGFKADYYHVLDTLLFKVIPK